MEIKTLLTTQLLKYITYKASGLVFMILAVWFIGIREEMNIFLGVTSLFISIYSSYKLTQIKPAPLFATCLDKSSFYVGLFIPIIFSLGFSFLVGYFIIDFKEEMILTQIQFLTVGLTLFIVGLSSYLLCCKRKGLFKE